VTRYELLDRIGVGGMAEIFRGKAVAAGGFEKPVAIKRILPHLSQDRRFVELLIAEAKVLSLLKHRNIVQIFDVGLGDDGQYFLVMEYVDGKDLRAVQTALEVRRRRVPFDLALHIGAEICEALEHAHSARAPDGKPMALVHRDVSPSNVLLSRSGEVKLTDFGIAKRAEQEPTGTGAVRGKFAYISPEQARNEQLDPRSDVFSVAILMWELICNRRLFSGMPDLDALRAVREAQVPRALEIDARLPPELDTVLAAALSRDVTKRPTAGQFGTKLRAIRYGLDATSVGEPASELARLIDTAIEVQRQTQASSVTSAAGRGGGFDSFAEFGGEPTVIRIHTAESFASRDEEWASMAAARGVIDRFEEEETRQAQLTEDQLRILRDHANDTVEEPPSSSRPSLPGLPRHRRPTDEPTVASAPLFATLDPRGVQPPRGASPNPFGDESTRLVVRGVNRDSAALVERLPSAPALPTPPSVTRPSQPDPTPLPMPPQPASPLARAPGPVPQASTHGGGTGWQPNMPSRPLSQPPPDYPGAYPQPTRPARPAPPFELKPWMLVVGAFVMALLAFAITRAVL
jgi:serine/threonine protein kinase